MAPGGVEKGRGRGKLMKDLMTDFGELGGGWGRMALCARIRKVHVFNIYSKRWLFHGCGCVYEEF